MAIIYRDIKIVGDIEQDSNYQVKSPIYIGNITQQKAICIAHDNITTHDYTKISNKWTVDPTVIDEVVFKNQLVGANPIKVDSALKSDEASKVTNSLTLGNLTAFNGSADLIVAPITIKGGQASPTTTNIFQSGSTEQTITIDKSFVGLDNVDNTADQNKKVLVEVTKPLQKLTEKGLNGNKWSDLEGWSLDYYLDKVLPKIDEAWQFEYKLINSTNSPIKED